MEQWPEGPAADPAAARGRYDSGTRAERRALRGALRSDLPAAHGGAVLVLLAATVVGFLRGVGFGVLLAGAFAVLFLLSLAVMLLRGVRGRDAGRRAYVLTFGWANWL